MLPHHMASGRHRGLQQLHRPAPRAPEVVGVMVVVAVATVMIEMMMMMMFHTPSHRFVRLLAPLLRLLRMPPRALCRLRG